MSCGVEARRIARDCVLNKLGKRGLRGRVHLNDIGSELSEAFIKAVDALEHYHPLVYRNVSRQMCLTMTNEAVVRTTLMTVLEVLFWEDTTWGRMVAMFAVAGAFAEECVIQGHPEFVEAVLDCVSSHSTNHLNSWLEQQGGWSEFPFQDQEEPEVNATTVCGLIAALVGFVSLFVFTVDIMY